MAATPIHRARRSPVRAGPESPTVVGASGPMQIGIGGASSDNYDRLRQSLPDPSLGPHDPTTAVQLAALYLLKSAGAPTGQPIDAYRAAILGYSHDPAYVDRVLADAHAYQGAGTAAFGPSCSAALGTPLVPGTKARILPSGDAAAPADAPVLVQDMIAAGNRIDRFPYSYAGGHGAVAKTMNQATPDPAAFPGDQENGGPGYDCSSATDYVLYGGGFGPDPPPRQRTRLNHAGECRRARARQVGHDLRQSHPRLHRGRWDLLRHRGRAWQPAQPTVHRPAAEHRRDRAVGVLSDRLGGDREGFSVTLGGDAGWCFGAGAEIDSRGYDAAVARAVERFGQLEVV